MAEVIVLGSGGAFAGAGRHNPSVALLHRSAAHVFDCGEPVAALLYRHGIAVTSVRNIFVSYLHLDHLGGLPQLIHAIRLLSRRIDPGQGLSWSMHVNSEWHTAALRFPLTDDGTAIDTSLPSEIRLHLPAPGIGPLQQFLAACALGPERLRFDLRWCPITAGELDAGDDLRVVAVPSSHLGGASFTFVIEADGRKIIYSGDLGSLDDLLPVIDGTDLLLLECSHHYPDHVAAFVRAHQPQQTVLVHVHPGLEERATELARRLAESHTVRLAHEGMQIRL